MEGEVQQQHGECDVQAGLDVLEQPEPVPRLVGGRRTVALSPGRKALELGREWLSIVEGGPRVSTGPAGRVNAGRVAAGIALVLGAVGLDLWLVYGSPREWQGAAALARALLGMTSLAIIGAGAGWITGRYGWRFEEPAQR
jgi:hypothetical protein